MVESMGGKCYVCSYDRCNWSLVFHHLDPSKKDIEIGKIRANPRSWDKIIIELLMLLFRKNILNFLLTISRSRIDNSVPSSNTSIHKQGTR